MRVHLHVGVGSLSHSHLSIGSSGLTRAQVALQRHALRGLDHRDVFSRGDLLSASIPMLALQLAGLLAQDWRVELLGEGPLAQILQVAAIILFVLVSGGIGAVRNRRSLLRLSFGGVVLILYSGQVLLVPVPAAIGLVGVILCLELLVDSDNNAASLTSISRGCRSNFSGSTMMTRSRTS